jgi:nicotinamidase-related amidase
MFDTSFYIPKNGIPYTLVIIDVQQGYSAAQNPTLLTNLLNEIKEARRNDAAILFVNMIEHEGIGKNIKRIWEAAYDYRYFAQVIKADTDGSDEVIGAFKKYRYFNKRNIKVGGVYTDVCVADTVNKLAKKLPHADIEVLSHCCNSDVPAYEMDLDMYEDDGETYNPFNALEDHPNLKLIF